MKLITLMVLCLTLVTLSRCRPSSTTSPLTTNLNDPQIIDKLEVNCPAGSGFWATLDGTDIASAFGPPTGPTNTRTATIAAVLHLLGRPLSTSTGSHRVVFTCGSSGYTADFIPASLTVREHPFGGPASTQPPSNRSGSGVGVIPLPGLFVYLSGPLAGPRTVDIISSAPAQSFDITVAVVAPPNVSVAPIPLIIRAGSRGAPMTVTGVNPGTFSIIVTAPGFELTGPRSISGEVFP